MWTPAGSRLPVRAWKNAAKVLRDEMVHSIDGRRMDDSFYARESGGRGRMTCAAPAVAGTQANPAWVRARRTPKPSASSPTPINTSVLGSGVGEMPLAQSADNVAASD